MASDEHTAMAEARPWIGSLVSVGVFRLTRALRAVDCTKGAERNPLFFDPATAKLVEPSAHEKSEAVWAHIARAFREPVTRDDDFADYAPTQVIAEVFRAEGFDGVAYRSAFGSDCFNVALFDVEAAKQCMCSLHEIRDVTFKYQETANPYYIKSNADGSEFFSSEFCRGNSGNCPRLIEPASGSPAMRLHSLPPRAAPRPHPSRFA